MSKQAYDTAALEAQTRIIGLVMMHLFTQGLRTERKPFGDVLWPVLDLGQIGVRACHGCGCTDSCACPGGCSWVAPNLCSACVEGQS